MVPIKRKIKKNLLATITILAGLLASRELSRCAW